MGRLVTTVIFGNEYSKEFSKDRTVSYSNGRFSVSVVVERCKECGICINLCPTDVLSKGDEVNSRGYRYTIPSNIKACIGCRLCEINCPEFAIFVVEEGKK